MRFFILISYDGSGFRGWQKQKNGTSVQQHLENAFSLYLREKIAITGAGRTDAGVHARNYVAHFDSSNIAENHDTKDFFYKINAILPKEIVLHDICQVHENAHARFDAISRTYNYFIHTTKDPFCRDYSYFFPGKLNITAMNRACNLLLGERDFTSMAKLHSNTTNNICSVTEAHWEYQEKDNETHLKFTITANRFLRNMVRAIVGSLIEVGRGKKEPEWILEVLRKQDRSAAGHSVPAHALFFTKAIYPYKTFRTFR
jgi:tRNA pseudouridine38-40 synthase